MQGMWEDIMPRVGGAPFAPSLSTLLAQGQPICGLWGPRGLGLHQFNTPTTSIYTSTPVLQHPGTSTVGDTLLPPHQKRSWLNNYED